MGEVSFNEQFTDLIATNMKGEKDTIVGIEFTLSVVAISLATRIPNHGEYWFKGTSLDLEQYKPFLKSPYIEAHSHIIPF